MVYVVSTVFKVHAFQIEKKYPYTFAINKPPIRSLFILEKQSFEITKLIRIKPEINRTIFFISLYIIVVNAKIKNISSSDNNKFSIIVNKGVGRFSPTILRF